MKGGFLVAALLFSTVARAEEPLWSELSQPGHARYQALLVEARRLRDGDLPAAEQKLVEATKLLPGDTAAWIALGEVRRLRRDFPGAHAALEQARNVAPDAADPELAFHVATMRAIDGDLEGSLAEYRRCEGGGGEPSSRLISLTPGDPSLLPRNEGDVYMALGRLGEAIAAYRRSLGFNNRNAIVHFALAVAYDRDEQAAASRSELELALAIDSFDLRSLHGGDDYFVPPADRHYYLALAHLARGRLAAGRAELRAFVVEAPHGPYVAHARDRLAAVPDLVDPRELGGQGYDRPALARLLSPRRAQLEHCLRSDPTLPSTIRDPLMVLLLINRSEATSPALSLAEQKCVAEIAAPLAKQLGVNALAQVPLARPEASPTAPADP